MVSPGGDPVSGFSKSRLGRWRAVCAMVMLWFSRPVCNSGGPYLGHVLSYQAAFYLTGHRSIDQRAS